MVDSTQLKTQVATIFREAWTKRSGQTVPEPEDLRLGNDAVEFERATILYADLSGSTRLVDAENWTFAAEIYKAYLHCAANVIRNEGGAIVSYDGDRVMGVFIGDYQTSPAARAGLKINWAVQNIINPALRADLADQDAVVGTLAVPFDRRDRHRRDVEGQGEDRARERAVVIGGEDAEDSHGDLSIPSSRAHRGLDGDCPAGTLILPAGRPLPA